MADEDLCCCFNY